MIRERRILVFSFFFLLLPSPGCHLVMPVSDVVGPEAVCGDGVLSSGETCDGTALGVHTCISEGFLGGILACSQECALDTSGCSDASCGNGLLDDGEDCDPGVQAVEGCDSQCRLIEGWSCEGEPSVCAPVCGDGLLVGDEACEGQDVGTATCEGVGLGRGTVTCDPQCQLDFSGCFVPGAITCGADHSCLATSTGALHCWGGNADGQVGDGTTTNRRRPVMLDSITGVVSINASDRTTCATSDMTTAGTYLVYCWGTNDAGALGTGDAGAGDATSPLVLPWSEALSGVSPEALSGLGQHQCVRLSDGTAACWGLNEFGQVGDGQPGVDASAPLVLAELSGLESISGGLDHSCALLQTPSATSNLSCWGHNADGQLGDGTELDRTTPVEVAGFYSAVSCGGGFTCAVSTEGEVLCWGLNNFGQLGDGTTTSRTTPVVVALPETAVAVFTGLRHACALLSTGQIACWGRNRSGQLGDGTTTDRTSPVVLTSLSDAVGLATGHEHTCAVLGDGQVFCWGSNSDGQLGVDNNRPSINTPTAVVF